MSSFTDFYGRYHGPVRAWALTVYGAANADDIAQETMARALTRWDRLDHDRDPWPWLVVVARNIARDLHRAGRALPPAALATLDAAAPADPPHEAVAVAEERRLVLRALRRLSAPDRDLLVLREWHELTFDELSLMTGRKPNAIRQQVFRARRRLAAEFTALGGRALGVGTALAARWSRGRRGARSYGDLLPAVPAAGQLAGALFLGGLVLGGASAPTAGAAGRPAPEVARGGGVVAGDVRAAEPVPTVAAPPRSVAKASRVAAVPPGTPRRTARPAAAPPVAAPAAPPPRVTVSADNRGKPGTPRSGGRHGVTVDVAGQRLYVESEQWGSERAGPVCSLPHVDCS